jgi:hypothetical protein
MKRNDDLSLEALQLELATAEHELACARLAGIVSGEPVAGWIASTKTRIGKLRKLLAAL